MPDHSGGDHRIRGETLARRLVFALGLPIGLCCLPPVFDRLFAVLSTVRGETVGLLADERTWLWAASLLLIVSLTLAVRPRERPWLASGLVALLLPLLLLVGAELGSRVAMRIQYPDPTAPNPLREMAHASEATHSELLPHPLLHYVKQGRLWSALPTVAERAALLEPKAPGVRRILLLGGSTSDMFLAQGLKQELLPAERFEVQSLATIGQTSAHSLVNLALNGVAMKPDFVVIHHGWNDAMTWGFGDAFRPDYFHALEPWTLPVAPDRLLVQTSVLYRWLRYGTEQPPPWMILDGWRSPPRTFNYPEDPTAEEIGVFRRNLEQMVILAEAAGAHPVLATMPRSVKPEHEMLGVHTIPDCNEAMRALANELGDRATLVDLDEEMTGIVVDEFTDIAHLTPAGDLRKAELIIAAIRQRAATATPTPGPPAP